MSIHGNQCGVLVPLRVADQCWGGECTCLGDHGAFHLCLLGAVRAAGTWDGVPGLSFWLAVLHRPAL